VSNPAPYLAAPSNIWGNYSDKYQASSSRVL